MKRFLVVMTAAALCLCATGCLQQAQQLPLEDVLPAVTLPEPSAQETEKTHHAEATQPDLIPDHGGWTVTLPGKYAHLLLTTSEAEAANGRQVLLSVYEKASVEAAAKDMGESRGMGFLFGITMLEGQAYQDWLTEDFPGYTLFACDDAGRYFFRVEPTDIRFYRSQYTTADAADWKTLSELAVPTCQQFITDNCLTPYTRAEALKNTAVSVLPLVGQGISPDQQYEIRLNGADTSVVSGGASPPESITIHDRTSGAVLWEDTGYYRQAALWSPDGSRLALARTARTYCFITIINTQDWTSQNADLRMPDGSTMEEYMFLRDDAGDFGTGMRWLSEGDLQISLTSATHQTDYQAVIRAASFSAATLTVKDERAASIRIPAVLDNADSFSIPYSLPVEVTARSDWNYDAQIQKVAEYPDAELELYDLREPW